MLVENHPSMDFLAEAWLDDLLPRQPDSFADASFDSENCFAAEQLRIKIRGLLREHAARQGNLGHLLHAHRLQQASHLCLAAIHGRNRLLHLALVADEFFRLDRLRRNPEALFQHHAMPAPRPGRAGPRINPAKAARDPRRAAAKINRTHSRRDWPFPNTLQLRAAHDSHLQNRAEIPRNSICAPLHRGTDMSTSRSRAPRFCESAQNRSRPDCARAGAWEESSNPSSAC